MKKTILALALALAALAAGAQEKVTVANYAQAERFSTKKVGQMVYSTSVRPHWFKGDDRFWYSYKTSAGTRYWLVDPAKGTKKELFDLPRLAMQISEIVRDPFDAQHLPMQDLKLRDDKYFTFDIRSTAKEQDPDDSTKTRPKVFHFKYDIASGKLEQEPERKQLYPDWANVSPDGTIGVYAKGSNLWWMDSTSMRKAVKDPKDSTIVEHRITSDGVRQNGYGYENYKGDTTDDPE